MGATACYVTVNLIKQTRSEVCRPGYLIKLSALINKMCFSVKWMWVTAAGQTYILSSQDLDFMTKETAELIQNKQNYKAKRFTTNSFSIPRAYFGLFIKLNLNFWFYNEKKQKKQKLLTVGVIARQFNDLFHRDNSCFLLSNSALLFSLLFCQLHKEH